MKSARSGDELNLRHRDVFGWPVLAMVALGLADAVFGTSSALLAREAAPDPSLLNSHFNSNPLSSSLQRRTNMEVILLERVAKLGQMGRSRPRQGRFCPQFLLKRARRCAPRGQSRQVRCMKAELEAKQPQGKGEATRSREKIDGRNVVVLRQASETGIVRIGDGSRHHRIVRGRRVTISRSQVMLDAPGQDHRQAHIGIACIRKSRSA